MGSHKTPTPPNLGNTLNFSSQTAHLLGLHESIPQTLALALRFTPTTESHRNTCARVESRRNRSSCLSARQSYPLLGTGSHQGCEGDPLLILRFLEGSGLVRLAMTPPDRCSSVHLIVHSHLISARFFISKKRPRWRFACTRHLGFFL